MRYFLLLLLLTGCTLQAVSHDTTRVEELRTRYAELFAYEGVASYAYVIATEHGTVTVSTSVERGMLGTVLTSIATSGTLESTSVMTLNDAHACVSLIVDGAEAECPAEGMDSALSAASPLLFAGISRVDVPAGVFDAHEYVTDDVHYFVVDAVAVPVRIEGDGFVMSLLRTTPLSADS